MNTAGLSDEEKRQRIAEACVVDEWVIVKQGFYYRVGAAGYTSYIKEAWKLPEAEARKYEMYADRDDVPGCEKVLIERAPLPDYLNCLNAMHEAEKTLTEEQAEEYFTKLMFWRGGIREPHWPCSSHSAHATAAQRAAAFLACLPEPVKDQQ